MTTFVSTVFPVRPPEGFLFTEVVPTGQTTNNWRHVYVLGRSPLPRYLNCMDQILVTGTGK